MIEQTLHRVPRFTYCPALDPEGYPAVKSVWIEGMPLGGQATKYFGVIGFPEGASEEIPVPAVVLVHGGGGFAFPEWVERWNRRGYAAIACCNTGYYPTTTEQGRFSEPMYLSHTLTEAMLAEDPRILTPDNDGMYTSDGDLDRMWMYHAVTQTILAHNILREDPRVDADRIGITGISWGGVITAITIGYDCRFAFAVPVYGCGYLHESLSWMKHNFHAPGARERWDASRHLSDVDIPVLWLAWPSDPAFSLNTNDRSCGDTKHGIPAYSANMGHSHPEGWAPPEIFRFSDSVVRGGEGLTTCRTQPAGSGTISFDLNMPADAVSITARVRYLTARMTYSEDSRMEQVWQNIPALVTGNTVLATIPSDAWSYYVEISTTVSGGETYVTSSRYITLRA